MEFILFLTAPLAAAAFGRVRTFARGCAVAASHSRLAGLLASKIDTVHNDTKRLVEKEANAARTFLHLAVSMKSCGKEQESLQYLKEAESSLVQAAAVLPILDSLDAYCAAAMASYLRHTNWGSVDQHVGITALEAYQRAVQQDKRISEELSIALDSKLMLTQEQEKLLAKVIALERLLFGSTQLQVKRLGREANLLQIDPERSCILGKRFNIRGPANRLLTQVSRGRLIIDPPPPAGSHYILALLEDSMVVLRTQPDFVIAEWSYELGRCIGMTTVKLPDLSTSYSELLLNGLHENIAATCGFGTGLRMLKARECCNCVYGVLRVTEKWKGGDAYYTILASFHDRDRGTARQGPKVSLQPLPLGEDRHVVSVECSQRDNTPLTLFITTSTNLFIVCAKTLSVIATAPLAVAPVAAALIDRPSFCNHMLIVLSTGPEDISHCDTLSITVTDQLNDVDRIRHERRHTFARALKWAAHGNGMVVIDSLMCLHHISVLGDDVDLVSWQSGIELGAEVGLVYCAPHGGENEWAFVWANSADHTQVIQFDVRRGAEVRVFFPPAHVHALACQLNDVFTVHAMGKEVNILQWALQSSTVPANYTCVGSYGGVFCMKGEVESEEAVGDASSASKDISLGFPDHTGFKGVLQWKQLGRQFAALLLFDESERRSLGQHSDCFTRALATPP